MLLAMASGTAQAAVRIHAVRVGLDAQHTRLVLASDRPIRARVTRDPPSGALLIDLDDVPLSQALAGLGKAVGANNPFIAGVRLCPTGTGTRLELAAPAAVTPRLLHLQPGDGHANRLVIDLYPASADWHPAYASAAQRQATPPCQPLATALPTPPASPRPSPTATPAAGTDAQVRQVRVIVAPDRVRLVMEADRPLKARIAHPLQPGGPLSIDLGAVALDAALQRLPDRIGDNPYLSSVRFRREGGNTSMELLAPGPLAPQVFRLAPVDGHGDRLVIDVFPALVRPGPVAAPLPSPAPAAVATATPAPVEPTPPVASQTTSDALTESWLEVRVNGTAKETVLVLQDAAGHVLVRTVDLQHWRIAVAATGAIAHNGDDYCPLSAIPGLSYRVDAAHGTLLLQVAAEGFAATRFSGISRAADQPMPSPPGAFVNYDVYATRTSRSSSSGSALVETGLFGRWGSGSSVFLARHTPTDHRVLRLDTVWTYDQPAQMTSLRLGDVVSSPGSWGRGVRLGGLQWGTNFATQPEFIRFPLPTLAGVASTPSTVDFYVNDVLRLRREVPAGPFTIQDLPTVTGQGDIRMVVRDMLGREQVVTQPFYASTGMLAAGLRDFSYGVGFERRNYGQASNDYGPLVANATERLGISDTFTGELHAEARRDQQTVGLAGNLLLGSAGLLSASLAGSRDGAGTGALFGLGIQHQSLYLSYGANTELTTAGFVQLGYGPTVRPPRQTSSAFLNFGTSSFGSLGLNYTHQDYRGQNDIELIGAHYSRSVGPGYLSLSALRFLGGDAAPLFSLTFSVPLGARDSVSLGGQTHAGSTHGNVQYQHNLPVGSGIGYRLQAGVAAGDPRQADFMAQSDVGTYTVGVASNQGQQAYQASVRGGFAWLGGKLFPSRYIDDSFAVVQVPGFANVRVYADNQPVATTDEDGYALVPRLRPYQKNPIRIEQADLPMNARVQGLQLDVVPYYHSALSLTFPVSRSNGAIVVIKLEDGRFLPAGAEVAVEGNQDTAFPVGLDGEVYLTGLQADNRLHVTWQGKQCNLQLHFPRTSDPLPRLGPLTCQETAP